MELAREHHCLPWPSCSTLPERLCASATGAYRPRLRAARAVQPRQSTTCRSRCASLRAGGVPRGRAFCAARRRGRLRRPFERQRSGPTGATITARSTSSATSTAATTSSPICSGRSATSMAAGRHRRAAPGGAAGCSSSATWSTGVRPPRRAAPGHGHGCSRHAAVRARQPRRQAAARPARPQSARHPRAGRVARAARRGAAGVPRPGDAFIDGLVSHFVLDDGKLVVAHAGMREEMQGRGLGRGPLVRLYGETTGETDEFGLPVRYPWAAGLPRPATGRLRPHAGARAGVAEQHDLHRHRLRLRRAAHGAALPGARAGVRAGRRDLLGAGPAPAAADAGSAARRARARDDLLDIDDVLGKRIDRHPLAGNVTVREENAVGGAGGDEPLRRRPALAGLPAADDVAAGDQPAARACWSTRPRRSPTSAAKASTRVVCEQKHMGSRAVVLVCRDERRRRAASASPTKAAGSRIPAPGAASLTTRPWRRSSCERVRDAAGEAGLWEELGTDWLCLDCELLPWSAKARDLLRRQYAASRARRRGRRSGRPCPRWSRRRRGAWT